MVTNINIQFIDDILNDNLEPEQYKLIRNKILPELFKIKKEHEQLKKAYYLLAEKFSKIIAEKYNSNQYSISDIMFMYWREANE